MITLYSKPDCPYCDQAKAWLAKNDIAYTVLDINEDRDAKDFLVSSGHKTVPQIYLRDQLLVEGGFAGLSKRDPQQLKEEINAN
jgi:glutaredoxin-like protein NrdH